MPATIKVRVSGECTVRYSQVKFVPEADWDRYQALIDEYQNASGARQREIDREIENMADLLIDPNDMCDADEIQDFEMSPYREPVEA